MIPACYRNMMSTIAPDFHDPPWSMIIPSSTYRCYIENIVNYVKENISVDPSYYESSWIHGNKLLNSLRPSKVDGHRINEILNSSVVNAHVLETFKPRGGGYAQPVVYDRFGTVTGRLTVDSGPNILLLKREYRSVLKPTHPGGAILSIDFSSLEARILLYESGNDCEEQDMYAMLARKFGDLPRDLVKAAVLSVLYGSSKSMVALNLGVSETKVIDVINQIEKYIDTKGLLKKLKQEHKSSGHIKNRHGRKIEVDRPQDNIFISYYAQSTGVDVSLMGFNKLVEGFGSDGIRPIFVLHDALILDVHPDRLEDVYKTKAVTVPGYTQTFPLKIEEISK